MHSAAAECGCCSIADGANSSRSWLQRTLRPSVIERPTKASVSAGNKTALVCLHCIGVLISLTFASWIIRVQTISNVQICGGYRTRRQVPVLRTPEIFSKVREYPLLLLCFRISGKGAAVSIGGRTPTPCAFQSGCWWAKDTFWAQLLKVRRPRAFLSLRAQGVGEYRAWLFGTSNE